MMRCNNSIDPTMHSTETLRLYIYNANLRIRTVLQLAVSVRNVAGTAATVAVALRMPYFFLSYVLEVSISERQTLRVSSFFCRCLGVQSICLGGLLLRSSDS